MFKENVSLAKHSHYKIGGQARYYTEPRSAAEIAKAVYKWTGKLFVLGGGTNILFPDGGIDGLVLRPDITTLKREGNIIRAGAGVLMSDLLNFVTRHSLSGLEWAGGLPGTVGGAVRGNAGAFGGEIKDSILEVVSVDITEGGRKEPVLKKRTRGECNFGYRNSIFKNLDKNGLGRKEVITECSFRLAGGDKGKIQEAIQEKIDYRKARHPIEYPNIGSIFKNVKVESVSGKLKKQAQEVIKIDPFPVIPVAYLLSESGLRGVSCGGAMFSPKHPNFIVNVLNADAQNVQDLITLAKKKIKNFFNVELEEEVIIL